MAVFGILACGLVFGDQYNQSIGCEIDDIFLKYLGKTIPFPERLPEYKGKKT
jgi:hypothetical protein